MEFAIQTAEKREGIDKVFCVFDRDNHTTYNLARERIRNYRPSRKAKSQPLVQSIISSPCFEIWLLLHFTFTAKPYASTSKHTACDNLINELRQYMHYTKNCKGLFEQTCHNLGKAMTNAKRLKRENQQTGTDNPDTDVHLLIEHLEMIKIRRVSL